MTGVSVRMLQLVPKAAYRSGFSKKNIENVCRVRSWDLSRRSQDAGMLIT